MVVLSVKVRSIRALGRMVCDLGTRAAPSLPTSERSVTRARTIHDGAEGRLLCTRPRSHLLGGTSLGS
jgi:hypothetical protein